MWQSQSCSNFHPSPEDCVGKRFYQQWPRMLALPTVMGYWELTVCPAFYILLLISQPTLEMVMLSSLAEMCKPRLREAVTFFRLQRSILLWQHWEKVNDVGFNPWQFSLFPIRPYFGQWEPLPCISWVFLIWFWFIYQAPFVHFLHQTWCQPCL